MKNSLFDHWLNKKLDKASLSFDKDQEWDLLLLKIQTNKRKRRFAYWIFLPLILIGLGIYYIHLNDKLQLISIVNRGDVEGTIKEPNAFDNKQNIKQSTLKITTIRTAEESEPEQLNAKYQNKTFNINQENGAINHHKTVKTSVKELMDPDPLISAGNETITSNESSTSEGALHHSEVNKNPMVFGIVKVAQNEPVNTYSQQLEVSDVNQNVNYILSVLESKFSYINDDHPMPFLKLDLTINNGDFKTQQVSKPRTNFTFGTSISYGQLFQTLKGESELISERQKTEKAIDLISIQCLAQHKIYHHVSLRAGFEWSHATIGFHQQFKDTVKTNLHGQIIREKINAQSVSSYDTGTISVTQYRNVNRNHYNHRTQFNIPIYLTYQFLLNNRWNIQPHIGIGIPVYQSFNGRVIDSEQDPFALSEYGKNVTFFPVSCSYRYGMEVVYSIKDYLNLNIGLSRNNEFQSWSDRDHSIREKHGSIQIQFGIFYKLK